jgi:hypothetical protein
MGVLLARGRNSPQASTLIETASLVFWPSSPHRFVRTAVPNTPRGFRMLGTSMRYRPICVRTPVEDRKSLSRSASSNASRNP